MAKIADFLDLLVNEPEVATRYDICTDDPMDEFGLDEDQKKLIRYGSPAEVKEAIERESDIEDAVYILRMLPPPA